MRRLTVCQIITQLELGGAQELVLETAERLDRRRFIPQLLAGPGGLLDRRALAIAGLHFETVPALRRAISPFHDPRALIDLVRRLRRLAPDVVHTHSSKAGILGRWAAAIAGVPAIIHTVHGWGFHPWQSRAARLAFVTLEQCAGLVTSQWIAVSRANAATGVAQRIAVPRAFEIVPPGVLTERFRRAARGGVLRAELGLLGTTPLVGMVACLKPQKAPLDFVAVAARVAETRPDAHFVHAGDGELRADVERAIEAAGLSGRFHCLGWRTDPEVIIGDLDVFVLSSLHEGLPMVLAEAAAAGVPVVATAVDGSPEIVREGETGFLRPARDVPGLADAVLRLLGDRELATAIGQRARDSAEGWDITRMVETLEAVYERVGRLRSAQAASFGPERQFERDGNPSRQHERA